MTTTDWQGEILDFCRDKLSLPGRCVTVACSGGADSLALLLFLWEHRETLNITVEALHIDHGLRQESPAEADFVEALCRERKIDFHKRVLIPGPNPSEDWARRQRYKIYEEFIARGNLVATAHTLSDQAETVLLRLARGTGVHGLAGIPAVRGGVVRPFLGISRQQTEDYCRSRNQTWVTDSSNLTDAYARNRVRHHVVPGLETVNPQAQQAIARMAAQLAELDGWLTGLAQQLLARAETPEGYSLKALSEADPPIRQQALRMLVARYRDPEEKYLHLLEQAIVKGGGVQLTNEVNLLCRNGTLSVCRTKRLTEVSEQPISLKKQQLSTERVLQLNGWEITLRPENRENFAKDSLVHKKDYIFAVDYDRIPDNLVFRTRQAGDTFCHPLRGQTKTLKKWDNELAVPTEIRSLRPLLAAGNQVIYLCGQGVGRSFLPGPDTSVILTITEKRKEEIHEYAR